MTLPILLLFVLAGACLAQESGRQTFAARCAACHGLDGRGGERAPGIANSSTTQARTDQALMKIIREGIPKAGMPSFSRLPDPELKALVQYLRFLGGRGTAKEVKGDPVSGQKLFFGKARCGECHMMEGKGGFIGPDLSEQGRLRSPDQIRKAIVSSSRVLPPEEQMASVETKQGEQVSGQVRNEDNFSLQLLGMDGTFHLLMKSQIAKLVRDSRSIMPADYGSQLSAAQLDDLVSYIVRNARPAPLTSRREGRRRRRGGDEE